MDFTSFLKHFKEHIFERKIKIKRVPLITFFRCALSAQNYSIITTNAALEKFGQPMIDVVK